ncbi:hypothetical protein ACLSYX_08495 [[Pasteurella] aerogenes]|uniref:Uncharacterized protein n=1 Tax=[Pasteurella] mairii TaxID=757 RepID=A0A379B0A7_9PAST|nr:hypothetical protein [[Pasteurella] mairii]SUB28743.1 Uncharacterised protein [[Pasteurella] mairii]SUB33289.1 Uncharacterised protein [[Pasteurella] mairii]
MSYGAEVSLHSGTKIRLDDKSHITGFSVVRKTLNIIYENQFEIIKTPHKIISAFVLQDADVGVDPLGYRFVKITKIIENEIHINYGTGGMAGKYGNYIVDIGYFYEQKIISKYGITNQKIYNLGSKAGKVQSITFRHKTTINGLIAIVECPSMKIMSTPTETHLEFQDKTKVQTVKYINLDASYPNSHKGYGIEVRYDNKVALNLNSSGRYFNGVMQELSQGVYPINSALFIPACDNRDFSKDEGDLGFDAVAWHNITKTATTLTVTGDYKISFWWYGQDARAEIEEAKASLKTKIYYIK